MLHNKNIWKNLSTREDRILVFELHKNEMLNKTHSLLLNNEYIIKKLSFYSHGAGSLLFISIPAYKSIVLPGLSPMSLLGS